jgi:hypothetical protein
MKPDIKITKPLIALSILLIIIVIYNRGNILLNSEIVSAQITSCKSISIYDDDTDRSTTSYAPIVESENGILAEGEVLMPNRATCFQQIGKHVSVLYHKQNSEENRIYTFIQFWALPSFLLFFPVAFLITIYSPAFAKVFALLYFLGTANVIYSETGYLEKHFPVLMTGKSISQSESALTRCVNTSMRSEYTTKRSEIKKLSCTGEEISGLSSISDLINLENLNLSGNHLTSLQGLENLSKLKKLSVSTSKFLISTKGIESAINLVEFQANRSGLRDLSGLEELSNLKVVELMMNELTSVSEFRRLRNIETVRLSYNPISDISVFKHKTSLIKFTAHSTKITDISPLLTSINLQVVGVSSPNFQCAQLIPLKEILISTAKVYGPSHCE